MANASTSMSTFHVWDPLNEDEFDAFAVEARDVDEAVTTWAETSESRGCFVDDYPRNAPICVRDPDGKLWRTELTADWSVDWHVHVVDDADPNE